MHRLNCCNECICRFWATGSIIDGTDLSQEGLLVHFTSWTLQNCRNGWIVLNIPVLSFLILFLSPLHTLTVAQSVPSRAVHVITAKLCVPSNGKRFWRWLIGCVAEEQREERLNFFSSHPLSSGSSLPSPFHIWLAARVAATATATSTIHTPPVPRGAPLSPSGPPSTPFPQTLRWKGCVRRGAHWWWWLPRRLRRRRQCRGARPTCWPS